MNTKTTFVLFSFLVVFFLMHLVQCRDIGRSAMNEQLIQKSHATGEDAVVTLRSTGLASGEDTEELTIELTPLDNEPLNRKKRAFVGPGSFILKAFAGGKLILHTIVKAFSGFTKGLSMGLIG